MLFSLLVIIYVTFMALGFPDSALGSSFPAIAENLGVSSDMAGYLAPIVSFGTIISSLLSDALIRRFTTKWVTTVSIFLTGLGLLLFSFVDSGHVWTFFPIALLMGLGAGGVDAALNNFVALHYKAIHMNWLHCCWGVGTTISPLIIGSMIDSGNNSAGWNKGILIVSLLLFGITFLLLCSLPLWNRVERKLALTKGLLDEVETAPFSLKTLFSNPVFYLSMAGFFCYCAMEGTTGLWLSTFLNKEKGLDTSLSASLGSTFYIGITIGRFLSGPLSLKCHEKTMIRIGEALALSGILLCLIPIDGYAAVIGFVLTGIGCAPIYPAIIRSTPYRFSRTASQRAMGLEMAIAYLGNLSIPPLFALTARSLGDNYGILPFFTFAFVVIMIVCHEIINVRLKKRDAALTEAEKEEYRAA